MVTLMKHVSTEKKSQDERIVIYYSETWWKALGSFQSFFLLKEIKIFRVKKPEKCVVTLKVKKTCQTISLLVFPHFVVSADKSDIK